MIKMLLILCIHFTASQISALTKIVIIDFGYKEELLLPNAKKLLCKTGHKVFTKSDDYGHGSEVLNSLAIVLPASKKYCVVFYTAINTKGVVNALKLAKESRVKYINLSMGNRVYIHATRTLIRSLLVRGINIYAAAMNDSMNLNKQCNIFPVCYLRHKNLIIVGALDEDGSRSHYSNYGDRVSGYFLGVSPNGYTGTSFAAPYLMGININNEMNNDRR